MMDNENYIDLLSALRERFEKNPRRHPGMKWDEIIARIEASTSKPAVLHALSAMEATGGEPDVVGRDAATGQILFCDCAAESPSGRRSLCYDQKALDAHKENKPRDSALGMAASMGIELLDEREYRALQELGEFDMKTSTWIATPDPIRALGGALFCDCRYGQVFVYHNGADSYYGARGFRGMLRV